MIQEFKFKDFLINEQQNILSQKIGSVLSALQTLNDEISNLGTKDKNSYIDRISSDIRTILRSNWPKEESAYLTVLQKIAVAMKKTVNERGDIEELLPNVIEELSDLLEKMGSPVNTLVPTEKTPPAPEQLSKSANQNPNIPATPQTASAEAPVQPRDVERVDQGQPPPSSPDLNLAAQPLGGSSGPLLGM
jgi:hypothetical protein